MMVKLFHLLAFLFLLQSLMVQGALVDDFSGIEEEVHAFLESSSGEIQIVQGTYTTAAERLAFAYLRESQPQVARMEPVPESSFAWDPNASTILVLIGGPKQNSISKELLDNPDLRVEHHELTTAVVDFVYEKGRKVAIIFSDKAGYYNAARTSAEKSPLASFIPVKYVPVVATGISFFLLWLWKFLFHFSNKILRLFVSAKVMKRIKKKELKAHFRGTHLKGIRIKWREWLAIFMAALVFAIAISYTFLSDESVLEFVLVNVLANMVIYALRNLTRLVFDRVHGHHTEYVFWWWGGLITILSGWLGNTFSLAGYVISEDEKDKKTEGKVNFYINLMTFLAFLVFFVWNFLAPSVLVQMIMLLAISIGFIQMLPLRPFSGKSIYAWKKGVWWITFLPMLAFYV
ncbi:MAG: hypothetical protein GXP63_05365, partial [DPANN group archaeon]|nr:hypothetical protein [DPANN group archaeon]